MKEKVYLHFLKAYGPYEIGEQVRPSAVGVALTDVDTCDLVKNQIARVVRKRV